MSSVQTRMVAAFKLPPKLCDALYALYTATLVPCSDLDAVTMHRLRKYLKPLGIEVESRKHVGYWLTDKHKKVVRQGIELAVIETTAA